jgi:hypothetical protein
MERLMWGFAALLAVLACSGTFAWFLAWRLGRTTRPATPKALNEKQALKALRKNIRMDERWRPQGELLTGGLHRIPTELAVTRPDGSEKVYPLTTEEGLALLRMEPDLDGCCDCEDHD